MNSPSKKVYKYGDSLVEVLPYYLYEVSIYKIQSTMSNLLSSRLYSSNKLLQLKEVEKIKKTREYTIIRFITLIGCPKEFIEEQHLPIYEPYKKKLKKYEKRTN